MIDSLTVVAATGLEARAVRRALPGSRPLTAGVGLSRLPAGPATVLEGPVVACGVAGSLSPDVPTGTVLVPARLGLVGGELRDADPELVRALCAGARRLGLEPDVRPLLTSHALVLGEDRATWAARGFAGADMETALLRAERVATVRVVLDAPGRELSGAWLRPWEAVRSPAAWAELPWLVREGPRCAGLAAAVLAAAVSSA